MAKVTIPLLLLLMANYHILSKASGHMCEPCEENKQCNISYTIQDELDTTKLFSWLHTNNEVMTCYHMSSIYCVIFPQYAEYISFSTQNESGSITLSLIFLNIKRQSRSLSMEGTWTLKTYNKMNDAQLVLTCDLIVFRKPTDIYCEYASVKQGLKIFCVGEMSYPEMACTVNVQVTKEEKPKYISPVYNNTGVQDTMYYKSTCLVIIPCELLINEFIIFLVRFFPRGFNSSQYLRGGSNYSSYFKIDYLGHNLKHYTLTDKQGTQVNVYCPLDNVRDSKASTIDIVNNFNTAEVNKTETKRTKDLRLLIVVVSVKSCTMAIFGMILLYRQRLLNIFPKLSGSTLKYRPTRSEESYPKTLESLIKANNFGKYFPVHLGTSRTGRNFSGYTVMSTSNKHSYLKEIKQNSGKGNSNIDGILENSLIIHERVMCDRNLHLENFIKVEDFDIKNLPDKYQDQTVFDCIKVISELTGKVEINVTSTSRQAVDLNTIAKYPGWNNKNTRNMRTGTGTVVRVIDVRDHECPCPECEESPSKVFYLVYVLTAKHVVFDDTEARQSFFRIGYNTEKSPLQRLYGLRVVESDINAGGSFVEYVTHESNLGIRLSDTLKRHYLTEKKIPKRFLSPDDNKLAVIVSHPHGEPKRVSIGEWVDRDLISTPTIVRARYFYTTETCEGSSGAAVIVLGDMLPRVTECPIEHHIYNTTDIDGLSVRCFRILSKWQH